MSATATLAKNEMLEVLGQIETQYHAAEEIVLAFRGSLDAGSDTPDISRSLQPVMDRLAALDHRLSSAYGRWQLDTDQRDQDLQAAVDRARGALTRLFQHIDTAMTTAQSHLQQLAPSVAAASSHRQMTLAYRRGTSSNPEANR